LLHRFQNRFVFVAAHFVLLQRVMRSRKSRGAKVMHLFLSCKLEMPKPRRYPPRLQIVSKRLSLRTFGASSDLKGRSYMDALNKVKGWIGGLTEIGLMLLALAIVAALLVGSNLPFFGNVTGNIMALVKSLGDAGLVGLIALGVILWLFSSRKMA
jgi:hypothetical protein